MTDQQNIFCKISDLINESDVEQKFIIRLLNQLNYKDSDIRTKENIEMKLIGKGEKKKRYAPDYIVYINKIPKIIIDAKNPKISPVEGLRDSLMYAREMNGEYIGENPIQYCIGNNGILTIICRWDENKPILQLKFNDFQFENKKFNELKTLLLKNILKEKTDEIKSDEFEFRKPRIDEIKGIFKACHNIIWRKEKLKPSDAFYEFVKIMFIKIDHDKTRREDKKTKEMIETKGRILKSKIYFSTEWLEKQRKDIANPVQNPINDILFNNLKQKLENEYRTGKKKRIFERNERIKIKKYATIKEVVDLLEHLDLYGIDEDLNGRLFETFLNATMRGKELGQFFTPRSVVEFMTKMANMKITKEKIPYILDGCCGTAGFLIESMALLFQQINFLKALSKKQKEDLIEELKLNYLYGIDASEMLTKIARINMYLHGDGGTRIYNADGLDKEITVDGGLDEELIKEIEQLKKSFNVDKIRFDFVLTNPPFGMKYEKKDAHDKQILLKYDVAYKDPDSDHKNEQDLKNSVRSNILFIERYYDLLENGGKLLTIIDESVLNTEGQGKSMIKFRKWLMNRFYVQAIVSLPKNTFTNADVNPKTSILFLEKKIKLDEDQPTTFYSESKSVGHNDAGKQTDDEDLSIILEEWRKFLNE